MSIHTFEIVRQFFTENTMRDLRRFLPPFGFENAQIQRLVNNSRRISLYETQSLAEQYHILGFGEMTVSKVFVEGYPLPIYHIYVVINPRLLIDGYETMNLFESTPENIEDLCNTFRSVLLDSFLAAFHQIKTKELNSL